MSRRNATNDLPSSVSIPISVGMLPTTSPITDIERDAEKGQDQRVKEQNNIYKWMGRYTYLVSRATPEMRGLFPTVIGFLDAIPLRLCVLDCWIGT